MIIINQSGEICVQTSNFPVGMIQKEGIHLLRHHTMGGKSLEKNCVIRQRGKETYRKIGTGGGAFSGIYVCFLS
jgi:hypothetical protein